MVFTPPSCPPLEDALDEEGGEELPTDPNRPSPSSFPLPTAEEEEEEEGSRGILSLFSRIKISVCEVEHFHFINGKHLFRSSLPDVVAGA